MAVYSSHPCPKHTSLLAPVDEFLVTVYAHLSFEYPDDDEALLVAFSADVDLPASFLRQWLEAPQIQSAITYHRRLQARRTQILRTTRRVNELSAELNDARARGDNKAALRLGIAILNLLDNRAPRKKRSSSGASRSSSQSCRASRPAASPLHESAPAPQPTPQPAPPPASPHFPCAPLALAEPAQSPPALTSPSSLNPAPSSPPAILESTGPGAPSQFVTTHPETALVLLPQSLQPAAPIHLPEFDQPLTPVQPAASLQLHPPVETLPQVQTFTPIQLPAPLQTLTSISVPKPPVTGCPAHPRPTLSSSPHSHPPSARLSRAGRRHRPTPPTASMLSGIAVASHPTFRIPIRPP